ncbi:MAG: DUF5723 family protein [Bacteroidota bacterium]
MINKVYIKTSIIATFFVLLMSGFNNNTQAQQYNTIYWMQGIPQSVYSNPAHRTDAGIYIGMPGLSSIYFGFGNDGFKISDLLVNDNSEFYWDEANFLSVLNDKNLINTDLQMDIIAFGFKYKENNYFNFNFSEKIGMQLGYPKDFMLLLLEGNNYFLENSETGTANFDGFGLNVMHYSEFALGYSRVLNESFDVGLKAKVLFGHANTQMLVNDFRFVTDPETFDLGVYHDITVNSSLPIEIGPIDIHSEEENNSEIDIYNVDPLDYGLNTSNLGFSFDIGGIYRIDDNITLALSVIDLGYIKWNSGLENYNATGEIEYTGFDAGNLFEYGRRGDGSEEEEETPEEDVDITEELLENVDIIYSNDPYSVMLSPKFFLSGKYNFSDIHSASLLARGNLYNSKLYTSYTVAYNIQPIRPVGFSLSYSIINNTYTNIGFGTHLNLYPLQLYIVADNIYPAFKPHTLQNATVHIGLNWVLGYREKADPAKPIHCWSF